MIRDLDFLYKPLPWIEHAACVHPSVDPDWFFPISEKPSNLEQRKALEVCKACPVKTQCLTYALEQWPVHGIWGGLKNNQLRYLSKQIKEKK